MNAPRPFLLAEPLKQAILEMAWRAEIRSISCPFDDFDLWKGLLSEQARRSKATGLPPQEALCLIGPDSGVPGIADACFMPDDEENFEQADQTTAASALELRGGEIHIPFEGTTGADLFILPEWHNAFPDVLSRPGAKLHCMVRKPCNYLLTNRDLGEHGCAARTVVAGCFLYKSTGPYINCNPFLQGR